MVRAARACSPLLLFLCFRFADRQYRPAPDPRRPSPDSIPLATYPPNWPPASFPRPASNALHPPVLGGAMPRCIRQPVTGNTSSRYGTSSNPGELLPLRPHRLLLQIETMHLRCGSGRVAPPIFLTRDYRRASSCATRSPSMRCPSHLPPSGSSRRSPGSASPSPPWPLRCRPRRMPSPPLPSSTAGLAATLALHPAIPALTLYCNSVSVQFR